jgi:hypothetical protein
MTEISHDEIINVADNIMLPPYDSPREKQIEVLGAYDYNYKATLISLGLLRGIAEIKKMGYKIVKE